MTPATEAQTCPGEVFVVGDPPPQLSGESAPLCRDSMTTMPHFDAVKGMLSDRPLHRPNRTRPIEDIENEIDLAAIEASKDDPGEPWDQVKDELGL